ncbi:MAG TPA: HD domain-containing phosphohydrolase [Abditibacterium sp.]|jgi:HD-GYP domain-containing protein (c-di-GMP phosphodiesterase class II)
MSQAQNLIRTLEDNSLSILSEAITDVRTHGGPTLVNVSDEDLQIALYTVLLKIIDTLREKASAPTEVKTDTKVIFVTAIRDMMDYIDGQSSYTVGHTRAVTHHVVQMASRAGLTDIEIDDLETAAWIHNIGLINQSQKLAALPRTLTQDELKQARNHTVMGAEMIRPIQFLSHLVPTIRYHHNRFDGNNNPQEPAGETLPLGARLICLADAYQAMLEPRAYRPALTRQAALLEIDKGSGLQFDPNLVPLAHELA